MDPVYHTLSQTLLNPTENYEDSIKKSFLHILDSLVSLFIITPLVVFYWNGTWHLIQHYYNNYLSWAVWSFSVTLLIVFNAMQPFLKQKFIHPKN